MIYMQELDKRYAFGLLYDFNIVYLLNANIMLPVIKANMCEKLKCLRALLILYLFGVVVLYNFFLKCYHYVNVSMPRKINALC